MMVTSSIFSSALNRWIGRFGGWVGWLLILVGLAWLAAALLPRLLSAAATSFFIGLLPGDLPPLGGLISLLLGVICFVWGQGMLRYKAWAPFVAALFLIHLAIYVVVFGVLLSDQVIIPPTWMLPDSVLYHSILQATVVVIVGFLLILALVLLIGPWGLRRAYVVRYQMRPAPLLRICPTCRSIIERPDGVCDWCQPLYAEARLEPVGPPPCEPVVLAFNPEQNRLIIGRRTPERPSVEAGHVYLDSRLRPEYETISAIHAVFSFDEESGQFLVEDLGSRNGTRLTHDNTIVQLTAHTGYPLMDGDLVDLGGARFRFRVVSVALERSPQASPMPSVGQPSLVAASEQAVAPASSRVRPGRIPKTRRPGIWSRSRSAQALRQGVGRLLQQVRQRWPGRSGKL